jgi:hypothetical protein
MLTPIANAHPLNEGVAEAAVRDAMVRGWLLAPGEPHSIALTDPGRVMASTLLGRERQPSAGSLAVAQRLSV